MVITSPRRSSRSRETRSPSRQRECKMTRRRLIDYVWIRAYTVLGRELLCRELGVLDSAGPSGSAKLPLLYSLVSGYRDLRRQHSDAHARALVYLTTSPP